MNFFERNLGRFFRKRLEEHEFTFDEEAWEQMASKLDADSKPSAVFKPRHTLFALLSIAVLIATFLFFYSQNPERNTINLDTFELDAISGAANEYEEELAIQQSRQFEHFSMSPEQPNFLSFQIKESLFYWGDLIGDLCCYKEVLLDNELANPINSIKKNAALSLEEKIKAINEAVFPEKVYLQLDKTIVNQGEDLWFKAYVRDANTFKPSGQSSVVYAQLINPQGKITKTLSLIVKNGGAAGDFHLGSSAKEGQYKVRAFTNWQRNQKEFFERSFLVQHNKEQAIDLNLNFEQKAIPLGNMLVANLSLKSSSNESLGGYEFDYIISMNGEKTIAKKGLSDRGGHASIRHEIPIDAKAKKGTLKVLINYRGQSYSVSQSFDLIKDDIDLQFFPEGGELLAGIPTKVAFKAVNSQGESIRVKGIIKIENGKKIAAFETEHAGMGSFLITPKVGTRYTAVLSVPNKLTRSFKLPKVKATGYSLRIKEQKKDKLLLEYSTPDIESALIVGRSRGKIIFSKQVLGNKEVSSITIPIKKFPLGISQFTLFNSEGQPQSERLVFLNKDQQLQVSIATDKTQYRPREKVEMTIKVADKEGNPVPGNFSLAVTDNNLNQLARDQQADVMAYMLLESDLKGNIEQPNYYFGSGNPKADAHLDLLLLSQGYRRFSWKKVLIEPVVDMKFIHENGIVKGQLLDVNNQPLKDAVIRVANSKLEQRTSAAGEFSFASLDLRDAIMLHIEAEGYGKNWYPVFGYSENLRLGMNKYPMRARDLTTYSTEFLPPIFPQRTRLIDLSSEIDLVTETIEVKAASTEIIVEPAQFKTITKKIIVKAADGSSPAETKEISEQILVKKATVTEEKLPAEYEQVTRQVPRVEMDQEKLKKTVAKALIQDPKPIKNPNNLLSWGFENKGIHETQINFEPIYNANPAYENNAPTNFSGKAHFISKKIVSSPKSSQIITIPAQYKTVAQQILVDPAYVKEVIVPAAYEKVSRKVLDSQGNYRTIEEEVVVKAAYTTMEKVEATYKTVTKKVMTKAPSYELVSDPVEYAMQRKRVSVEEYNAYADNFKYGFYRAREFYSPKYGTQKKGGVDHRSTLFWEPNLTIGPSGSKVLSFYNSDALTTITASAQGFSDGGGIGQQKVTFEVLKPISLEAKLPKIAAKGDRMSIPFRLKNLANKPVKGKLKLNLPTGFKLLSQPQEIALEIGQTKQEYVEVEITDKAISGDIILAFETGKDLVTQKEAIHLIEVPKNETIVYGSRQLHNSFYLQTPTKKLLSAGLTIYPDFGHYMANKVNLESSKDLRLLLDYCQQNLAVLGYTQEEQIFSKKSLQRLKQGYEMLKDFEVQKGGFGRYGEQVADAVLTAEVIRSMVAMKAYFNINKELFDRSAAWLLAQKNGKGGWKQERLAQLKGVDSKIADAYILWCLTEAGFADELVEETQKKYQQSKNSTDNYFKALVINTLVLNQDVEGTNMLFELLPAQQQNGAWKGSRHSAFLSTGGSLDQETTSLVVLALLRTFKATDRLEAGINFLYGNTGLQGAMQPALVFNSLAKYERQKVGRMERGELRLLINGTEILMKKVNDLTNKPIVFNGLEEYIGGDAIQFELWFDQTRFSAPFELNVTYAPKSTKYPSIKVTTQLDTIVQEGETLRFSLDINNNTKEDMHNTVTKIALSGGTSLQDWQLKSLMEKGLIDAYEMKEGWLLLYNRMLEKERKLSVKLDLKADIPGVFNFLPSVATGNLITTTGAYSTQKELVITKKE